MCDEEKLEGKDERMDGRWSTREGQEEVLNRNRVTGTVPSLLGARVPAKIDEALPAF